MTQIPEQLSNKVNQAISKALEEEKIPFKNRMAKIILIASVLVLFLAGLGCISLKQSLPTSWTLAFIGWWTLLIAAFTLYFKPEPKLEIQGNLSSWIFAKIIISMTVITIFELLICPSFVVMDSISSWTFLAPITDVFMSWGGMKACMFLCGFIFVGLGSLASFLLVAKSLSGSSFRGFIKCVGIAYLTQLPILWIQLCDEMLRETFLFWLLGSVLSLLLAGLIIHLDLRRFFIRNNI